MAYNVDLYPTPKNASQRVKGMAILTAFLEVCNSLMYSPFNKSFPI